MIVREREIGGWGGERGRERHTAPSMPHDGFIIQAQP